MIRYLYKVYVGLSGVISFFKALNVLSTDDMLPKSSFSQMHCLAPTSQYIAYSKFYDGSHGFA